VLREYRFQADQRWNDKEQERLEPQLFHARYAIHRAGRARSNRADIDANDNSDGYADSYGDSHGDFDRDAYADRN
jgi:hypothetical protein